MIVIDKDKCKLCGLCVNFCPKKRLFIKGKELKQLEEINCISCKICENYCPDMAIEVVK